MVFESWNDSAACEKCGSNRSRVTDSRDRYDGRWRRRECLGCGHRRSTVEKPEKESEHERKLRLFINGMVIDLDAMVKQLKALQQRLPTLNEEPDP